MVARNDITGDVIINTPKQSHRGSQSQRQFSYNMPEFKVYDCPDCHIKVSTSNDCCPCCGKKLT